MSKLSLRMKAQENSKRPCDVYGCPARRKNISRYCVAHYSNLANTGHLEGRLIPRSTIKPLQKSALDYINAHLDHPLITKALDHIQLQIIDKGKAPNPPYLKPRTLPQIIEAKTYAELRRLQIPSPIVKGCGINGGSMITERPAPVSAAEVLAVCTGVWLATKLNQRLLKDDGDSMTWALANGVLGLRMYRQVTAWSKEGRDNQTREPGAHARRTVGTTVRPLSYVFQAIAEKIAPYIVETPEQALARQADERRPLPDADVPLYVPPAPSARVIPLLPPRYARPQHDPHAIEVWSRLDALWTKAGM